MIVPDFVAAWSLDAPWIQGTLVVLWVILYVFLVLGGTGMNLFGLPGNWVMLGTSVLHVLVTDTGQRVGYGVGIPITLLILALAGEGLEALAGILGAGKAGGSRRAMVLSMIGGIAGSLVGFSIGNVFVPILGGIIGIVLIAGLGSLAGAWLGETWKGRNFEESMQVGRGAFVGRILGTLGKTFIGSVMLLVSLVPLVM